METKRAHRETPVRVCAPPRTSDAVHGTFQLVIRRFPSSWRLWSSLIFRHHHHQDQRGHHRQHRHYVKIIHGILRTRMWWLLMMMRRTMKVTVWCRERHRADEELRHHHHQFLMMIRCHLQCKFFWISSNWSHHNRRNLNSHRTAMKNRVRWRICH